MKKTHLKKRIVLTVASLISLISLFLLVQPEGKSLIYIFIPVLLLWIFLFSLVSIMMILVFKTNTRLHTIATFVGVSAVVLMVLLSGVDQLTVTDVVLATGLVAVSGFYFYRMWGK